MPNSVPARVDRNAFFLQWSEKMSELKKFKEERGFLEFLTNAMADVLQMDIGICIQLVKKTELAVADVGYKVVYIKDNKRRLSTNYPEIKTGMEIARAHVHPYFKSVWDIKMNTFAEPFPGLGIDFFMPMRIVTVINIGTFASPIILLDDSETAVDLSAITATIRAEAMKIRRLYDNVTTEGGII